MATYIIRRLALILPTIILVTIIVFVSLRFIPGSVIDVLEAQMAGVPGFQRGAVAKALGLDVPIYIQYGRYLWGLLHGDLGVSLFSQRPVTDDMWARFPLTLELGVLSIFISLIISIPIGVYSAVRQDTIGDYVARSFAIICIAVPSFWLATLVIVYPSIWWGWMPSTNFIPFLENPLKNLEVIAIPSFILGMSLAGVTMRMTRTMMLEVLRQDYIRTAWSKGLAEKVIIFRHALKNALIPVITLIGALVSGVAGGAVVIEQIFSLPGIGRLLLEALNTRNYPMVSGIVLILSIFVYLSNLAVDVAYAYLDPRIRYE